MMPGQGAQKKGMGLDLYNNSPAARAVFEFADKFLGYPITDICFNDPDGKLSRTEFAQPAIAAVGIAAYRATLERFPQLAYDPAVAGGAVSFGELPHLVVSGVWELEDLFSTVKDRAQITQQVGTDIPGKMLAVANLEPAEVEEICERSGVWPAIKYPAMTVISGALKEMDDAHALTIERGGKVFPTGVDFAFHTPIMKPAEQPFRDSLAKLQFRAPRYSVVMNSTAEATTDPERIRELLPEGLTHSVDTRALMATGRSLGVDVILEFGPGPVLVNHLRRENPQAKAASIHNINSLRSFDLVFDKVI